MVIAVVDKLMLKALETLKIKLYFVESPKGLKTLDNLRGLSVGFGAEIADFKLDYAYTPYGELGNAQRLTLSVGF